MHEESVWAIAANVQGAGKYLVTVPGRTPHDMDSTVIGWAGRSMANLYTLRVAKQIARVCRSEYASPLHSAGLVLVNIKTGKVLRV